jgi:hypothetical protein
VECDFGQVQVDFAEGRRPVWVLIATWSFSHLPFMIALPTQRTEAILQGMVLESWVQMRLNYQESSARWL